MDELLDLIFEIESSGGRDKSAYVPNPKSGALGGYQMKVAAFQDIQKLYPKKWKGKSFKDTMLNDTTAREASKDYLQFLELDLANTYKIAPTRETMLAAYNQGAKGISTGDKDTLSKAHDYVTKANNIKSKYTTALAR